MQDARSYFDRRLQECENALFRHLSEAPERYILGLLLRASDYLSVLPQDHALLRACPDAALDQSLRQMGLSWAFRHFYGAEYREQGGPEWLLPSAVEVKRAACLLADFSRLSGLKQLKQMIDFGLGEVTMPKPGDIRFTTDPEFRTHELRETEFLARSAEREARWCVDSAAEESPEEWERVKDAMYKAVEPWRDVFIQYDSPREVRDYFGYAALDAEALIANRFGIPDDAHFGGVPFKNYRSIVTGLVAWAESHIIYAILASKKYERVSAWNNIGLLQETKRIRHEIASVYEDPGEEIDQIADILTLTPDTVQFHAKDFESVGAPMIQVGDGFVFRPASTNFDGSYYYLHRELQRRFPRDWSRAIQQREDKFRATLYERLPEDRYWRLPRSANIKRDGKNLTDIDAALLDRRSGTLGIFQLKWQDPYERSLARRYSQQQNSEKRAGDWVERLEKMTESEGVELFENILPMPRELKATISRVLLFVIGRHRIRFSNPAIDEKYTAWLTMPQLEEYLALSGLADDDVLFSVWRQARNSAASMPESRFKRVELIVPDMKVTVCA